jgi:hypothetical protein
MALVASGIAHVGVWGVVGGPWEGPVTWRKPILFGISGGLTCLSLGWAFCRLACRRGDGPLAWATALALFVEVALIDLQCWRGVASHFNRATPLDSVLYDVMGWLILGVTLVCLDLTARFFLRPPPDMPADMLLAARVGFVLLAVSCLLGIWASVHGDARVQAGRAPESFGAAGVVKFPHGAVIHAVQWLPALAWAARRAGIAARGRLWLVAAASVGSGLLLVYALAQTLLGRPRFAAPAPLMAVGLAAIALLAVPAAIIAAAWLRSRVDPRGARGLTAPAPSTPAGRPGARRAGP